MRKIIISYYLSVKGEFYTALQWGLPGIQQQVSVRPCQDQDCDWLRNRYMEKITSPEESVEGRTLLTFKWYLVIAMVLQEMSRAHWAVLRKASNSPRKTAALTLEITIEQHKLGCLPARVHEFYLLIKEKQPVRDISTIWVVGEKMGWII